MIKGISPQGKYMYINGGMASSVYISPGASGAGMVRWNPSMNGLEVNDGNSWKQIDMGYASVGLTPEAEALLDWIKSKQMQEIELLELASKNKAVFIALENVKKAQEQLTITAHLAKEENEEPTS
jgi:hypothetical protein